MPASSGRGARITLDPYSGLPAYLQIVRQVQQHTAAGRLLAGARLPTVRVLGQRLGVNFNTVARAYRQLARDGMISPQPGRGTFVLAPAARRRAGNAALQELALEYLARARRLQFTDAQITDALRAALASAGAVTAAGDKHE